MVEEMKTSLEKVKLEIDYQVEQSKLNLEAYTQKALLAEKVAETISNISAQAIASALGAINTSMSHGYHGGETLSEHFGHSDSIGESHSYQEL